MPIDLRAAACASALPYFTRTIAEIGGALRERPEDFRVDETPAYLPCGEGDHLYVRFEKRELDTPRAVRRIAEILGVDPRDCGWGGLKDRRAVTTQWASFLFGDPGKLEGASIEGVRVLESARHGNKLRTGHVRSNAFDLLLRGADPGRAADARTVLDELASRGVPNYFGPQRFGRDGSNLVAAARWILDRGRAPRKPFLRKLLVSVLQSAIFNELLAARVTEGSLDGALAGDLMRKEDTGGHFVCEDPAVDGPRAASFEISATGPMLGVKMSWPEGVALERERAAMARWALDDETLRDYRRAGPGTRRPYRVRLSGQTVVPDDRGLRVRFILPAGAYATVVLRELMRREVR